MPDRRHALALAARSWRWRLSVCLLLAGIAAAYLLGVFAPVDRFLSDRSFGLHPHQPSGSLVIVEIDTKSLQYLSTWPWSRAYHAALIDRLTTAGAKRIAFDIDFSANSSPDAELLLEQAITRAKGHVILSAFFSQADGAQGQSLSASMPMAALSAPAGLGLVNIVPDSDGGLRQYRVAEDRLPGRMATMAAVLAAPIRPQTNAFAIDYSIDPSHITHLSYVDVLTGRFDPSLIAGKNILVGATAIELGDRYQVPRHGIIAGVEIQALAYETLVLDRAIHASGPFWVLLGLLLIGGVMIWPRDVSWRSIHFTGISGAAGAFAIGFAMQSAFATSVDTAPWLAAIGGGYLIALLRHAREQARSALSHRAIAARQRALMQGVFNDSFDGILIIGASGCIELANAAAARLLETSAADLAGRNAADLLPGIESVADDAAVTELTVGTGAGRILTLAVAATRSQDIGGVRIVTFRDESARRAMEQAREQMLHELEAASLAKNEFLARISHELRTPLSAIIGFSTIISEQSIGPIGNPKYAEYARDVTQGGKRLLELVNDIIDVVRIEAGKFEIRSDVFEARSLLMGCSSQVRQQDGFGARVLRTEIAPGAEAIRSDRQALARAIAKLLENSAKFTRPDGQIVLRARPTAGSGIVIEVEDDGLGIAAHALKNVVNAFSQVAGGLNRGHEGTGLGLHLAYRIMNLLGGRLEIESTPGVGTCVRLVLDDAAREATKAA